MKSKIGAAVAAALALTLGASAGAQAPQAPPVTYIHAGALLDRPGQAPRGASTILVQNGRIVAVRDGFVEPEAGARVVDLRDQFVLPGLIDMHVHIFTDNDKARARNEGATRDIEDAFVVGLTNARLTVEAGFTTVRDLGSDARSVTALRDGINTGQVLGPTIYAAGRGISITAGHGDPANNLNRANAAAAREQADNLCNGAEACRQAVREQISKGADVIKFMATGGVNSNIAGGLGRQMFPDEMKAIVDTAHMFGRKVAAHAHGQDGIKAALEAGVDSIEHGTFTDAETNALFKRTGAWLVPTMVAPHASLSQSRAGARNANALAKGEEAAAAHGKNTAAAIKAGVKIAFGTDSGVADHGKNAEEFKLLVDAGMSPTEAIKSATVHAAELLGQSGRLGTIEPGKDADIIAVRGSPLQDVTELQRVQFVMRRGTVLKQSGQRQAFPPAG
jgi:imidazolonepropionase-like amidohydrolase